MIDVSSIILSSSGPKTHLHDSAQPCDFCGTMIIDLGHSRRMKSQARQTDLPRLTLLIGRSSGTLEGGE
jgi:hypothetical protein